MKHSRLLLSALLASATLVAGCKEGSSTGPAQGFDVLHADRLSDLRNHWGRAGMLGCKNREAVELSTSQTVGRDGGVIRIGAHTLIVPANALSSDVLITARVEDEGVNHVEFQPEGLQFNVPATLIMGYSNCDLLGLNADKRIAYTDNLVLQIYYRLDTSDDRSNKTLTAKLNHFSDYAVAW